MARTQATTTISPSEFILGAPITSENAQAVIEQLNWSYGRRPQLHVSLTTAPAAWSTNSPTTHGMEFRGSATFLEVYRFEIKVMPETVNVVVGAECTFASGQDGEVKFTIGASATTLSINSSHNGTERSATLATSATGTGWITCTIETRIVTGSTGNDLVRVRVQDEPITSSLPAPQNED